MWGRRRIRVLKLAKHNRMKKVLTFTRLSLYYHVTKTMCNYGRLAQTTNHHKKHLSYGLYTIHLERPSATHYPSPPTQQWFKGCGTKQSLPPEGPTQQLNPTNVRAVQSITSNSRSNSWGGGAWLTWLTHWLTDGLSSFSARDCLALWNSIVNWLSVTERSSATGRHAEFIVSIWRRWWWLFGQRRQNSQAHTHGHRLATTGFFNQIQKRINCLSHDIIKFMNRFDIHF